METLYITARSTCTRVRLGGAGRELDLLADNTTETAGRRGRAHFRGDPCLVERAGSAERLVVTPEGCSKR